MYYCAVVIKSMHVLVGLLHRYPSQIYMLLRRNIATRKFAVKYQSDWADSLPPHDRSVGGNDAASGGGGRRSALDRYPHMSRASDATDALIQLDDRWTHVSSPAFESSTASEQGSELAVWNHIRWKSQTAHKARVPTAEIKIKLGGCGIGILVTDIDFILFLRRSPGQRRRRAGRNWHSTWAMGAC